MDSETVRFIRNEIARQMNIILSAQAGSNSVESENIENLFPGMPTVTDRPVMHPYGVASRAPNGTISVVAKQGDHPGNRMVIGHRDSARPTDLDEGEAVLYSSEQMQARVENDSVTLGKTSDGSAGGFAGNSFVKVANEPGNETVLLQHKTGAQIQIDKNGSVSVASKDGSYMFMNAENGELTLASKDGNVLAMSSTGVVISDKSGKQIISLDGTNLLQLTALMDAVVSAPKVTIDGGVVNLGNNAVFSAVIAENLTAFFDTLIIPYLQILGYTGPTAAAFNANPATSFMSLFVKMRSNIA